MDAVVFLTGVNGQLIGYFSQRACPLKFSWCDDTVKLLMYLSSNGAYIAVVRA